MGGGTRPPTRAAMMSVAGTPRRDRPARWRAGAGTRDPLRRLPLAYFGVARRRVREWPVSDSGIGGIILRVAYPQTPNASRITYELTGQRVSGPADTGMGLVVRLADNGNYLFFSVFNDSSVVVFAKVNGSIKQLTDPGLRSQAVSANGPNTLRVVAEGSSFTIVVNGQPIGTLPIDGVWPSGAFGFGAIGGNDDAANCYVPEVHRDCGLIGRTRNLSRHRTFVTPQGGRRAFVRFVWMRQVCLALPARTG